MSEPSISAQQIQILYNRVFEMQQLEVKNEEANTQYDFHKISVLRRTLDLMRQDILTGSLTLKGLESWKKRLSAQAEQQLYQTDKFNRKLAEYDELGKKMIHNIIFSTQVLVRRKTKTKYIDDITVLIETDAGFRFVSVLNAIATELKDWSQKQEPTDAFYGLTAADGLSVMLEGRPDLEAQIVSCGETRAEDSSMKRNYEFVMDFILYLPVISVFTIGTQFIDIVERGEDIYGNKIEIFGHKLTSLPERIAYAVTTSFMYFIIPKFISKALIRRFPLGFLYSAGKNSKKMIGATVEYLKFRSFTLGAKLRPMIMSLYLQTMISSKPYWKNVIEPAAEHILLNNELTPELTNSVANVLPTMVIDISKEVSSILGTPVTLFNRYNEVVEAAEKTVGKFEFTKPVDEAIRIATKLRGAINYKDLQKLPEIVLQPNLLVDELAQKLAAVGEKYPFMKNFNHFEIQEMLEKALTMTKRGLPLTDDEFAQAIGAELVERLGFTRLVPALLSREGHAAIQSGPFQFKEFAKTVGYEISGSAELTKVLGNALENGKELSFIAGKFRILIGGRYLFTDGMLVSIENSVLKIWAVFEAKSGDNGFIELFANGRTLTSFVDNLTNLLTVVKSTDIYKNSQIVRDVARIGESTLSATIKDLGGGIKVDLQLSENCVFFVTIPKGTAPKLILEAENQMRRAGLRVQTWVLDASKKEILEISNIISAFKNKFLK